MQERRYSRDQGCMMHYSAPQSPVLYPKRYPQPPHNAQRQMRECCYCNDPVHESCYPVRSDRNDQHCPGCRYEPDYAGPYNRNHCPNECVVYLPCEHDEPHTCGDQNDRSREDIHLQLLQSIADEEAALAEIVNEEAKKTKSVAERMVGPFTPDEVIAFQRSVADILYHVKKKEELLIKKMRLVMESYKRECHIENEE